jgi:PAS domain S-box-containing protein
MKNKSVGQLIYELMGADLFDSIGDGISIQDTDYKILYQNIKHKLFVGDHIGEYCYKAYEKKGHICEGCPMKMTFKDGLPHTEERTAPTDREILHVEITASPLRDKTGKIIAGIEVVRDITERKKAEEALEKSEKHYRILVDRNPHGVQKIDIFGTIVYANKAHHEIYGYKEGALIGRSIKDFLVPGSQRDELLGYLEMLVKDQPQPTMYHQKILTKNGKERDIEVTWNYLRDTKGGVEGFLSVLTDITERKEAEKALTESDNKLRMKAMELEEINTALKVMLKQRENDKGESEGNILANVKHLMLPYIEKLKKSRAVSENLLYLNILESNLKEIISPFAQKLTSNQSGLTPKEIQVANLTSLDTVKFHRKNIRKKLGLYGQRTNLRSYLLSEFK